MTRFIVEICESIHAIFELWKDNSISNINVVTVTVHVGLVSLKGDAINNMKLVNNLMNEILITKTSYSSYCKFYWKDSELTWYRAKQEP